MKTTVAFEERPRSGAEDPPRVSTGVRLPFVPFADTHLTGKLQQLLSVAMGCTVLVSASPVRPAASRGAARFWVECFSGEDEGELRRLAGGEDPPGRGPADLEVLGLSAREAEVLFWIARGKTNPEVATILGIARRTVATHVEHILAKLSVENRGAASRCAAEVLFG